MGSRPAWDILGFRGRTHVCVFFKMYLFNSNKALCSSFSSVWPVRIHTPLYEQVISKLSLGSLLSQVGFAQVAAVADERRC